MDLFALSLAEAAKGLRSGLFTSEELTRACFERIDECSHLNSYVTLTKDFALERAKEADARQYERGLLDGIPGSLKDLFCTKGILTTASSRMLENFVPPYESTAGQKLKDAGYVLLGKTNLDEFAHGASTQTSYYGTSLCPYNLDYVAGGSTGGSAAAVASGQGFFSLGTDTGGSIRQPASLSGCVGLKVTYGRVSRFGVIAMASSWDSIGPMTRTVEDAALVLNTIAGKDRFDATTPDVEVPDYTKDLSKGVQGLKIGVPKEYFEEGLDDDVRAAVESAIKEYEKMGATIVPVSLPLTKYGVAVYYVTQTAEVSANMARFDGIRFGHKPEGVDTSDLYEYSATSRGEGFGDEVKRRIMVGSFVLSAGYSDAYYKQAQRVRTLIIQEFEDVFKQVDVLAAPVSPFAGMKVGENMNDPVKMYMADVYAIPASAAGIPSLSLPCGFNEEGLPMGIQIIGPQWSESLILRVGAALEQAIDLPKVPQHIPKPS